MGQSEFRKLIIERSKHDTQYDKELCSKATDKDIDWQKVKWFKSRYKSITGKTIFTSDKKLLNALGCAKGNKLLNSAVLLFGKNPQEFFLDHPLPTLAHDDLFYKNNPWHGPVSFQHVLWVIVGLKRYNATDLAGLLAKKNLEYLNESFKFFGELYPFYPCEGFSPKIIKDNHPIPLYNLGCSYYHPIHSIFYRGIAGGEILDNSINFVLSEYINKELSFSFNYRGEKKHTYLSPLNAKIDIILP